MYLLKLLNILLVFRAYILSTIYNLIFWVDTPIIIFTFWCCKATKVVILCLAPLALCLGLDAQTANLSCLFLWITIKTLHHCLNVITNTMLYHYPTALSCKAFPLFLKLYWIKFYRIQTSLLLNIWIPQLIVEWP